MGASIFKRFFTEDRSKPISSMRMATCRPDRRSCEAGFLFFRLRGRGRCSLFARFLNDGRRFTGPLLFHGGVFSGNGPADRRGKFFLAWAIGKEFIKNRGGNNKKQQNDNSLDCFKRVRSLSAFPLGSSGGFLIQRSYLTSALVTSSRRPEKCPNFSRCRQPP